MATQKLHRCPKCGYEYEPWIEICPDCGVLVEDAERPSVQPAESAIRRSGNPRWTVATNVPNAIIGNLIKSQLEDAGIPVLMLRSPSADVAQFSHNDFVPYDLRVPADLLDEARRLIDSAPGDEYGAQPWSEEEEEEDEQEDEYPPEATSLPEGWSLLPTSGDVRARQDVKRTHGESVRGWYWDEEDQSEPREEERVPYHRKPAYRDDEYYDERDYQGGGWSGRSRWIRIIYGILLAAISLPFILELLRQLWALLGGEP